MSIADNLQDQTDELVTKVQDATVDLVRTISEAVEGLVPDLDIDLDSRLPSPRKAVDDAFGRGNDAVKRQRDFALRLVDASSPLWTKFWDQASARPAAKTNATSTKATNGKATKSA